MADPTGPNFSVDQGFTKEWELTPDTVPPMEATAVLRLGRRELVEIQRSYSMDDTVQAPGNFTYKTVLQDDCEIDAGAILVSLDTSILPGIEYLWQVDLLDEGGVLLQRWRGLLVVTAALGPIST